MKVNVGEVGGRSDVLKAAKHEKLNRLNRGFDLGSPLAKSGGKDSC